MQRCHLMTGLLAMMLTAAGCCDNWGALGPEDLPRVGEVLTIDSPKRLLIREGETGYLGGTILVEEDGVLNLAVEGELSVAEEAGIETRGGRVAWTLDGILDGATFSLTNNGGGSIMLDAATGSINIGTLNILNGDQDINSDDESSLTWTGTGMRANNMNVYNYGGTTRITDTGMMQVSNMSLSSTDGGVLSMTIEGELSGVLCVADASDGGRVEWILEGMLDVANLSLANAAGGSITLDAAMGSIDIGNLNMNNVEASSLIWTSAGMLINNMNVNNYGGTTRITDAGTMQVSNMNLKSTDAGVLSMIVEGDLSGVLYTVDASGGGRVEWILEGALDSANCSLTNGTGGSITVDAASGSIDIGNLNINNVVESSLTWTSTGMRANNMNVNNYGGTARITDAGTMQVNNMNLKEQSDTESGGLTLTCNDGTLNNLAAVANGSGSALDILLQGQSSWNDINVDTNYGGSVRIDVGAEATVSCEHLYVDCNGASHGRLSNGELINAGNLTVDTLLTPVGCIYEDVTDPAGQSTWLVTFPGGETFTIINSGTLDMPLPF